MTKDEDKEKLLSPFKILMSMPHSNDVLRIPSYQKKLIESYRNKNPIILPLIGGNGNDHFYTIVLNQEYLMICNRGEGRPNTYSTITSYVIDPDKVNAQLFEWIYHNQNNYDAIYFKLPVKLQESVAIKKDFICDVLDCFGPDIQKEENCTYSNLKAAVKASWLSIKMIPKNDLFRHFFDLETYANIGEVAEWSYKTWSYAFRSTYLSDYALRTTAVEKDVALIAKCQAKVLKQKNNLKNYL